MPRVANIKHNPESACLGIGFSVVRKTFSPDLDPDLRVIFALALITTQLSRT